MPDLLLMNLTELAPDTPWLMPLFFALFGACIGSFLNVVIYRLPRGLSVSEPRRSFCPECKAPIPWYLNLPVLSWLLLRGRSACCHRPIAARYWWVEAGTAALFAAIACCFDFSPLVTVILLCAWVALAVACFCIDMEQMVVLPSLTLGATFCGAAAAFFSPELADTEAVAGWEGLLAAAVGAVGGFLFFKLVGLLGRLAFGRRRRLFDAPQRWTLHQAADGEDIELRVGDETMLWSELFIESGNRLTLSGATEGILDGYEGDLRFDPEHLHAGERVIALESVTELSGTCCGYCAEREAMGSGDAWLAMAIGALFGWQGVLFALVGGSFIGLAQAAVSRIGFGRPMPFGPALLAAALIWLFFAQEILSLYQG